jgi:endonuclease/exonuclease/phosphatase family metal-dependent hydrolase
LRLLTWNLKQNKLSFELALNDLANGSGSFIAAFQELPDVAADKKRAMRLVANLTSGSVICIGVVSARPPARHGRVGLFCSPDLSASAITKDRTERMAMTSIRSSTWSDLNVIGIHGFDRISVPDDYNRGSHATILRTAIEGFWKAKRPLILMGDFNADPYDSEVSSSSGMLAVRDREEAMEEWSSPLAGTPQGMRPLYNPMWGLLPEAWPSGRPRGTIFLSSMKRGIRWRLYDQILLSGDLVAKMRGTPEILAVLSGTRLVTPQGRPTSRFSDHLPVQLEIDI